VSRRRVRCAAVVLAGVACQFTAGGTVGAEGASAVHPATAPPTSPVEVQARLAQLRARFAPYLRSLPKALGVRDRVPLNGEWRSTFEVERAKSGNRPEPPAWFRPDFDDTSWEKTTVPEWRYAADGYRKPASCILWYRTTFPAAPVAPGRRAFLVFAGVDWEAEVWLNGTLLGRHTTYYEAFRFDVTRVLKEKNVLAVRVIDGPTFGEPIAYWSLFPDVPAAAQRFVRDAAQSIPGYQKGSLHLGSGFGIHREVVLETTGAACVAEIFVRADPATGEARIVAETDSAAAQDLTAEARILPENVEGPAYDKTIPCRVPQGPGKLTAAVPMPGAKCWSPDEPALYRCRVSLRDGDRVVDVRDVLFGCRSFALVTNRNPRAGLPEGLFLLNGTPVFLRGTNVSPALNLFWYWNQTEKLVDTVLLLKAANFNAIRACQHVHYPEVRELLDRLGMMSEQDQGGGRNGGGPEALAALAQTGKALARVCFNNSGVVLLSFANETQLDPTLTVEAVRAADPDRLLKPISGNANPKDPPPGYPKMPEPLWSNVIDDFHTYRGWYLDPAKIWRFSRVREPSRLVTVGEYGAEALDAYETMAHYLPHFQKAPPATDDTLWGHVQVQKADARQIVGFRGRKPSCLGEYIEASQTYQADVLAEVTTGFRLSPKSIAGYFQFHFIDGTAAHWPKSIVSFDLRPKKGYFEMAQVNQPVVPLFRLIDEGKAVEVWVASDRTEAQKGCRVAWTVRAGDRELLRGEKPIDVPPLDAALVEKVGLTAVPPDVDVIEVSLILSDAAGRTIARYRREVYLRAWRLQNEALR
jgi:beta-mannosidase